MATVWRKLHWSSTVFDWSTRVTDGQTVVQADSACSSCTEIGLYWSRPPPSVPKWSCNELVLTLQLQLLSCNYPDLEPVAGWRHYVPFHRGIQVSIGRQLGHSDNNLETSVLFIGCFYLHIFISLRNFCRLLPALQAHLPCSTLLNVEECIIGKEECVC